MEFLDSIDFKTKKKTNRVRSWYLYEQFKSLECNQLEAAKKLKNKYYQEKILRKELSERKARRSLYDQSENSRSDLQNACSVKSAHTRSSLSDSNDDFLESCYQLEDEPDHDQSEELSQNDSQIEHPSGEFKSMTDFDSIASVVENLKESENITDEIKEELEFVKHGIAENITLQLEAAKENVQCLEEFGEFCELDQISEKESELTSYEREEIQAIITPKESISDTFYDNNNLIAAWMKLVSFAYQVIKLNHGGNCYCDYSSQFLTAVLACDVLRRGINRMCDILQPYVCPIKLYNDETGSSIFCYKNDKRKFKIDDMKRTNFEPCPQHKKLRKIPVCKSQCYRRKYNSEKHSRYCEPNFKKRITSEPLPRVAGKKTIDHSNNTRSTLWPSDFLSEQSTKHCHCPCCLKFTKNPMLKVTKYLDGLLAHMNRS